MKITMLGTGRAVVTECYNTCFVLRERDMPLRSDNLSDNDCISDKGICDNDIQSREKYFLVDGGSGGTILTQLKRASINWKDIKDIFVTHRHMDHILGILWMMRMICQAMKQGEYDGPVRIYAHDEVIDILNKTADMLLTKKETCFIGKEVRLIGVKDGEKKEIIGHKVTFFDIHSSKAKQFGFRIMLDDSSWLTCCGDEPCNETVEKYTADSKWLLHEAFCLAGDAERFRPYEKHHSTVKDACEKAEKLGVRNLLLYHTEDTDIHRRKERYRTEGKKYFSGCLVIPDDLETIDLSDSDTLFTEKGNIMGDQQRLEAFEKMLDNVRKEYDSIQRQMDDLKEQGKTKSATYRQLMGRKMTYQSMISMYEVYGLL
ncbi:MAG TPA: MBL fold metallo-hydrolase [Candidatus Mediterraneibacter stercoripullorum]|nr:MBL fold metallo-hydrolase [Candidatus Mediterraneibacter stercoripullorum]